MTDRDDLAAILRDHAMPSREFEFPADEYECCADAVIERGWRPPARVIKAPINVDALPVGTLVRDDSGDVAFKVREFEPGVTDSEGYRSEWALTGDNNRFTCGTYALDMPVTVMHEPEEAR